jgi:hypothetical protein
MTYWLLHDICADLAKQEMVKHEFSDGDIHSQIVQFDGGGHVIVNRGKEDWSIDGHVLPQYGIRFGIYQPEYGGRRLVIPREGGLCGSSE